MTGGHDPWANVLDQLRGWLAVAFSAAAAIFAGLGWRLSRSNVQAHCDFVIRSDENRPHVRGAGAPILARLTIENDGRNTLHIDRVSIRSPRDATLVLARHDQHGALVHHGQFSKSAACAFDVAPGRSTEESLFLKVPSEHLVNKIRISVRMPTRSRVIRYKTRTLTAILPASTRKHTV